MITYECKQCGMAVKATCGKCDALLENGFLTLEDCSKVQISQCPSCKGIIKSPQCWWADMSCEV